MTFYYHSTHVKNLKSIKAHGFAPPDRRAPGPSSGATAVDQATKGLDHLNSCINKNFAHLFLQGADMTQLATYQGHDLVLPTMLFTGDIKIESGISFLEDKERLETKIQKSRAQYLKALQLHTASSSHSVASSHAPHAAASSSSAKAPSAKRNLAGYNSQWKDAMANFARQHSTHFLVKLGKFESDSYYRAENLVTSRHIYLFSENSLKKYYPGYVTTIAQGDYLQMAVLRLDSSVLEDSQADPSQADALISKTVVAPKDLSYVVGLPIDTLHSSPESIARLQAVEWTPLEQYTPAPIDSAKAATASGSSSIAVQPASLGENA